MVEDWFWVVVAACEVLLVLVILLGIAWLGSLRARRRDRKAIATLVKRIKKQRSARIGQLAAFLGERHGLSGNELNEAVTALYKAEVGLLQAFVLIYGKRNADAVPGFEAQVEQATGAYWALSGSSDEAAGDATAQAGLETDGDDGALDDGEVDRLRGENARLSDELRVTMDTMSRMLSEYSTVFTQDGEGANVTVVDDGEAPEPEAVAAVAVAVDLEATAEPDPAEAGEPEPAAAAAPNPDDVLADMGLAPEPEPAAEAAAEPEPAAAAAPNPDDVLADMGLDPEPEPAAEAAAEPEPAAAAAPNPDDVLADMGLDPEPEPAAEVADEPEPAAAAAPNPDDVLADMGIDEGSLDEADEAGRFSAELDEAARDLSDDDEPKDAAARAEAERQRIIDAES